MKRSGWMRRWWRRLQRRRLAKRLSETPLREFVYLDEVSVYSLVASRKGPIATDYRDTASTLLRSEVEGTAGVAVGVAKSEVSSRTESAKSTESQIVRKAVIQSTFRELYEAEKGKLVLNVGAPDEAPDPPEDLTQLGTELAAGRAANCGWAVAVDDLKRGQLMEIEVVLGAEDVYGFSKTVASVLELIQGNELMAAFGSQDLGRVAAVNQILERLLVGLVPLRGRATSYSSVVVQDREWVVHQQLLSKLPVGAVEARPISVVGVAEEQLFWKDVRRVLFGRSRYVVMARLGKDGLQQQWSPVKLTDVLRDVAPELADGVDESMRSLRTLMSDGVPSTTAAEARADRMRGALIRYGIALAAHYSYACTAEELRVSGLPMDEHVASFEPLEARREAFAAITHYVAKRFEIDVDPQIAAEHRQSALVDSGLWPLPRLATIESGPPVAAQPEPGAPLSDRYLDAEIVAIYW